MDGNLYSWHNEVMVALKGEELQRELESIRLLRDAGLSNPGWLERTFIAVGSAMVRWGDRLRKNYTAPDQAYQITSSKLAG